MRVWITACVLHLLAGCGTGGDVEPRRSSWVEPSGRYEYTLQSSCGERLVHGRLRLTVQGGEVVDAAGLDEAGRNTMAAGKLEALPSLKDLLAEYEQAVRAKADKAIIEFDPGDGHPTLIDLDPLRHSIDDEACYRISDYRVL